MANKYSHSDLKDSARDEERLKPEHTVLDLPDVKDIPGQENIHVPNMQEMADTTISSDDEEGVGIWDEETNEADNLEDDEISIDDAGKDFETEFDEEDNSADEDDDLDDLDIDDDESEDADADVTDEEAELLERSADNVDSADNEDLYAAELDDKDFDGEKLNEDIELIGEDLDVPGAELDNDNEEIGEEDEENNSYSIGDTE